MSQKWNFMTSVLADDADKWRVMNSSPHCCCCSPCLRPLLFCPSICGFALTELSLSFFFPLPFFINLISFNWWLFTCLAHSGQSVLPTCVCLQLVEITIYFARAPASSLFLICLVDLVAHYVLCVLASNGSRFWPSAGLQNRKPKRFFFSLHFW